jgi:hypothetical protein
LTTLKQILNNSKSTLKLIVESIEMKQMLNYRFDRSAVKTQETCMHCKFYKDRYCSLLDDTVKPNYTCKKFEKR